MKKSFIISFILLNLFIPLSKSDKIEEIIRSVDENSLYNYVKVIQNFGEHPTGSEACYKVGEYIFNEFEKIGLETEYFEWENKGYKGKNIVATIKGRKDSCIILSAHFDSYYNSPGADDDATGIACLLIAGKIFSKYDFENTIKLVAFSGEEQGMLGSQEYVKYLYKNGEDIIANINIDTVGYGDGDMVRVLTDEASLWITDFAEEVGKEYNLISMYRHGNFPAGDHQSFIKYGYEAVFFVEYNFNPNIHSPNDTIEFINKSYLAEVCKLVLATTAKIADTNLFRIRFEEPKIGYIYLDDRKIFTLNKPYSIIIGKVYALVKEIGNEKIERIEFYLDGKLRGFSYNEPYEYVYKDIAFFKHEIKAVAISRNKDICRLDLFIFNFLPSKPH